MSDEKVVVPAAKVVAAAPVQGLAPAVQSAAVQSATAVQPVAAVQPTMAEVLRDPNSPIMTMKKLLEAGVHFGHQTRRWNPKMGKFIYGARNGIYIIDLTKTCTAVNSAYKALKTIVDEGGKVLFVGTKLSAKQVVFDEAVRSGSFYINNRWLGGTLTNFRTILGRIKRLKDLEAMQADGSFDKLPKKEVAVLKKELDKLSRNLEGIKEMRRLPQALVIDDPALEHNAVAEALRLHIPTFAICDTSDNPEIITYPLPSNNDATAAVKLLLGVMADSIVESKGGITEFAYVKVIVAEVGLTPEHDQLYRLTYDGSVVVDEPMFAVMGGAADKLHQLLETKHDPGMELAPALRLAVSTLQSDTDIPLDSRVLEVAALDRGRPSNRKFRRLPQSEVTALLVADE